MKPRDAIASLAYSALLVTAGWIGCHYYEKQDVVAVIEHPQQTQKDDSVVAAVVAGAVKPAMNTPKQSKPAATGHVTFRSQKPVSPDNKPIPPICEPLICPAIGLDMALVRKGDGQQDLILKSNGVAIDKATFTPTPALAQRRHPNAAGPVFLDGRWGGIYERDIEALPARLGVIVLTPKSEDKFPPIGLTATFRW